MKSTRVPWLVLGALYVAFFACLARTVPQLPATVATHFGASGLPNGWMSQRGYAIFTSVFALVMPGIVVGSCALLRMLPPRLVNIPNRDHWLASEQRALTCADMLRYGLWFACLTVAFLAGVHWLIVAANRRDPPRLSTPAILILTVCFVAGMVLWILVLLRRFRKVA